MPRKDYDFRQFFASNGEYSSGRLVFIIGSFVAFGLLIYDHTDNGLQNIVTAVLGYSSASFTISKFSKHNKPDENK